MPIYEFLRYSDPFIRQPVPGNLVEEGVELPAGSLVIVDGEATTSTMKLREVDFFEENPGAVVRICEVVTT